MGRGGVTDRGRVLSATPHSHSGFAMDKAVWPCRGGLTSLSPGLLSSGSEGPVALQSPGGCELTGGGLWRG